jgi:hypothetical protein
MNTFAETTPNYTIYYTTHRGDIRNYERRSFYGVGDAGNVLNALSTLTGVHHVILKNPFTNHVIYSWDHILGRII